MTTHSASAAQQPIHRRLLTVAATAELLGVSARSVWRLIAARQLQVVRIGKAVRVGVESLDAFIAAGGAK